MSSIGPELPPHLLNQSNAADSDDEQGPSLPPNATPVNPSKPVVEEEDDEDDYAPALPPDLVASRSAGPSKKILGPAPPPSRQQYYDDDDSDDDVGPRPLPSGANHQEIDAVKQFRETEEKRRKMIEEASKPKALQRDEWMLVPPSSSDLLGTLDPTKLNKPRQFHRSAAPAKNVDNSLWTETPAERQQRLADEISGKKRRAVNADITLSPEEANEARKKQKMDAEVRRGVDEHTRKVRGSALVDTHAGPAPKDDDPKVSGIWDHGRDMSLGGRLMDDSTRNKMLKDAKGLGDRFGSGTSGGFL